jgi:hypothetical protein
MKNEQIPSMGDLKEKLKEKLQYCFHLFLVHMFIGRVKGPSYCHGSTITLRKKVELHHYLLHCHVQNISWLVYFIYLMSECAWLGFCNESGLHHWCTQGMQWLFLLLWYSYIDMMDVQLILPNAIYYTPNFSFRVHHSPLTHHSMYIICFHRSTEIVTASRYGVQKIQHIRTMITCQHFHQQRSCCPYSNSIQPRNV